MNFKGFLTLFSKFRKRQSAWALIPALAWTSGISGAEISKDATANALQETGAWVGGVSPTVSDVAVWSAAAGSLGLDNTLSSTSTWGGIKVTDIEGPLTIRLSSQLNLGNASGNLGLDLSQATADVLITSSNNAVINWDTVPLRVTVAEDRMLTIALKFGAVDRAQKWGEGTLVLQGANDNGGTSLDLHEGTVILDKASSSAFHGLGGGVHTIHGGTLKLAGTGGDQIYLSGVIQLLGGTFDLNDRTEGVARLTGSGGRITNSGTGLGVLTLNYDGIDQASEYGGLIEDGTGQVRLVKTGMHHLRLTGTNTYSGGTVLEKGTTLVATDSSFGAALGKLTLKEGARIMRTGSGLGDMIMAREIELGVGGGALRASHSQHIVVNGAVTGVGDLRIDNDSGTVFLNNGGNTYAGSTTIGQAGSGNNARLIVTATGALGAAGDLIFNAGTSFGDGSVGYLNLRGTTQTVSSLSTLTGRSVISSATDNSETINHSRLVIQGDKHTTYHGWFGNAVRLEHTGTGSLTLQGPNDNSGLMVSVSGGKVILAKDSSASVHALGGGTHTINSGATLVLGGTGNDQIYFGSTVQVNAGGTWDFGGVEFEDVNQVSGVGTITNTGNSRSTLLLGANLGANTMLTTFGGVIQDGTGAMALEKQGLNTLILNGQSTFTGGAEIKGGMLGGTGKVGAGPLTIASGAILSPGNSVTSLTHLGAGTLAVDGAVNLQSGSTLRMNVALGGNKAYTDKLKMMGALTLTGSTLDLLWEGGESLLFTGAYTADTMYFLTEGATAVNGVFSNFSEVASWGEFGSIAYAKATIGGQDFALFYHAQYGVYSSAGLTGGHNLLLMAIGAVPEPSHAVLIGMGLLGLGLRRCRK